MIKFTLGKINANISLHFQLLTDHTIAARFGHLGQKKERKIIIHTLFLYFFFLHVAYPKGTLSHITPKGFHSFHSVPATVKRSAPSQLWKPAKETTSDCFCRGTLTYVAFFLSTTWTKKLNATIMTVCCGTFFSRSDTYLICGFSLNSRIRTHTSFVLLQFVVTTERFSGEKVRR